MHATAEVASHLPRHGGGDGHAMCRKLPCGEPPRLRGSRTERTLIDLGRGGEALEVNSPPMVQSYPPPQCARAQNAPVAR